MNRIYSSLIQCCGRREEGGKESPPPRRRNPYTPHHPQFTEMREDSSGSITSGDYVALYDYAARTHEELSFSKGDYFKVFEKCDDGWWDAALTGSYTSRDRGYIPCNYVARRDDAVIYPWYYGDATRREAENWLLSTPNIDGSFLIRKSQLDYEQYALSIHFRDDVRHYRIVKKGDLFINPSHRFGSLLELVKFYQEAANGLVVKLASPCVNVQVPQTSGVPQVVADEWEIERNFLELGEVLGEGNFGKVYKALWKGKVEVAVKTLKTDNMDKAEFLTEAQRMKDMRHHNLVRLYGVCTQTQPFYIVTEYLCNGNLKDYLSEGAGKECGQVTLTNISAQIAEGMTYLEEKKYVHRDLAARNILVGRNNECRIADFGLSRLTQDDEYSPKGSGAKIPTRWTAPEALFHLKFSTKSDVWSFGILLHEIISKGETPYPGMTKDEVKEAIRGPGPPMGKHPNCPDRLYEIMQMCWRQEPKERPTFYQLQCDLDQITDYGQVSYENADAGRTNQAFQP
ncbi:tyrosine-protein kinase Src42A-like isoform X2 [Clavelina lepadiformis]|uniref:tyrosine-protein kinase Src42A-like isoform X2 n=1 Tax=Clavelina lepadiformis TaxID=159417 RepID=UPI00404166E5